MGLSWTWPGCRQQVLSSNRFPLTVMGSWQVRCCVSGTVGTKALIWPEQSLHLSMVYLSLFFFHSFILSFIHPSILSFILPSIHSFIHSSSHPFFHSFIHPFFHSFIHPFFHSFIHPFIHSFIHSSIHPSIHASIPPTLFGNSCCVCSVMLSSVPAESCPEKLMVRWFPVFAGHSAHLGRGSRRTWNRSPRDSGV